MRLASQGSSSMKQLAEAADIGEYTLLVFMKEKPEEIPREEAGAPSL